MIIKPLEKAMKAYLGKRILKHKDSARKRQQVVAGFLRQSKFFCSDTGGKMTFMWKLTVKAIIESSS